MLGTLDLVDNLHDLVDNLHDLVNNFYLFLAVFFSPFLWLKVIFFERGLWKKFSKNLTRTIVN